MTPRPIQVVRQTAAIAPVARILRRLNRPFISPGRRKIENKTDCPNRYDQTQANRFHDDARCAQKQQLGKIDRSALLVRRDDKGGKDQKEMDA